MEAEWTSINALSIKCNKNRVYYHVFNHFYSSRTKRKDDKEVQSDLTVENLVFSRFQEKFSTISLILRYSHLC